VNIGIAILPGGTRRMSHGTYNFGAIDFDVAVAVTNTAPMGAYRGAGRPEATALLERLVDQASHELGIDPIELRDRNLLTDDVFPFTTITGNEYDTGRYRLPLQTAADAIDYDALRRDQQARRERGDTIQLGIGVASYVEITAGGGSGSGTMNWSRARIATYVSVLSVVRAAAARAAGRPTAPQTFVSKPRLPMMSTARRFASAKPAFSAL
jgi:CO/xanthine dehydrogenase Mo-binding subunit